MQELASEVPEYYMANIGNFTCEGFVSTLYFSNTWGYYFFFWKSPITEISVSFLKYSIEHHT